MLELERSHAEQATQLSYVVEWLKKWQGESSPTEQIARQEPGVSGAMTVI